MKFSIRDVFYNNGLVNFVLLGEEESILQEDGKYRWKYKKNISVRIDDNGLEISGDKRKLDNLYNRILDKFIEKYLVKPTNNKRLYWDKDKKKIIEGPKMNVIGAGADDVKWGVYVYEKNLDKLGLTKDLVRKKISKFNKDKGTEHKVKDVYNNRRGICILSTLSEHAQSFRNYLLRFEKKPHLCEVLNIETQTIKLDSKIYPFEDGQVKFRDLLSKKSIPHISKWPALFYWLGVRTKRYFEKHKHNIAFYLFPNSYSLVDLFLIKKYLNIPEIIEGTDKNNSNIDFKTELGKYNFLTNSEPDWRLKVLLYIYKKLKSIEDANERYKVFQEIDKISFISFTESNKMKSCLNTYTQSYRLFEMFDKLESKQIENKKGGNLLEVIKEILVDAYNASRNKNNFNLLKVEANNILEFKKLIKNYMNTQTIALQKKAKSLPEELKQFEPFYLKLINESGDMIFYHNLSAKIGEEIGKFLGSIDDKALLFNLRAVRNYNQLIRFLAQFSFNVLKNEEKSRFTKEFQEYLKTLLSVVKQDNWETIRDYIAIYAIMYYEKVRYAKSQNKSK